MRNDRWLWIAFWLAFGLMVYLIIETVRIEKVEAAAVPCAHVPGATPVAAPKLAETHWLYWTNPCTNALQVRTVDQETGDSIQVNDCSQVGAQLRDLDHVDFYGWPTTGGLARLIARVGERGRECLADSIPFQTNGEGWHFFAIPYDTAGNGECRSAVVYLGPVTGVPIGDGVVEDKVRCVRLFNVRGQLAKCGLASGVYFEQTEYASGRKQTRKIVLKRGGKR